MNEIEVTSKNIDELYKKGRRDFRGMNLARVWLRNAYLYNANLAGTNLECAWLEGANLEGVNLRYANLRGANLYGANITRTKGIASVSGAGEEKRLIFAYRYKGANRFQLGCFNGTYDEVTSAIKAKYDTDELWRYLKSYLLAIEYLNESLNAQYEEQE